MKKFKIEYLKEMLEEKYSCFSLVYFSNQGENIYEWKIVFFRANAFSRDLKSNNNYILTVEKGKKGFDEFNSEECLIDERKEFKEIGEIVDYLDQKGYLNKSRWISEEDYSSVPYKIEKYSLPLLKNKLEETKFCYAVRPLKSKIFDKSGTIYSDIAISQSSRNYKTIYSIAIISYLSDETEATYEDLFETSSLKELISYLDKKGYLKREEWIIEEKGK